MNISSKYLVYLLSLYALFLCYFSALGIYGFLDNPGSESRVENLYLVALASVQGLILLIVFVFTAYILRNKVSNLALKICSLPFIFLIATSIYAYTNGVL
jgi:hypothetical protein